MEEITMTGETIVKGMTKISMIDLNRKLNQVEFETALKYKSALGYHGFNDQISEYIAAKRNEEISCSASSLSEAVTLAQASCLNVHLVQRIKNEEHSRILLTFTTNELRVAKFIKQYEVIMFIMVFVFSFLLTWLGYVNSLFSNPGSIIYAWLFVVLLLFIVFMIFTTNKKYTMVDDLQWRTLTLSEYDYPVPNIFLEQAYNIRKLFPGANPFIERLSVKYSGNECRGQADFTEIITFCGVQYGEEKFYFDI